MNIDNPRQDVLDVLTARFDKVQLFGHLFFNLYLPSLSRHVPLQSFTSQIIPTVEGGRLSGYSPILSIDKMSTFVTLFLYSLIAPSSLSQIDKIYCKSLLSGHDNMNGAKQSSRTPSRSRSSRSFGVPSQILSHPP